MVAVVRMGMARAARLPGIGPAAVLSVTILLVTIGVMAVTSGSHEGSGTVRRAIDDIDFSSDQATLVPSVITDQRRDPAFRSGISTPTIPHPAVKGAFAQRASTQHGATATGTGTTGTHTGTTGTGSTGTTGGGGSGTTGGGGGGATGGGSSQPVAPTPDPVAPVGSTPTPSIPVPVIPPTQVTPTIGPIQPFTVGLAPTGATLDASVTGVLDAQVELPLPLGLLGL
jgi:hypothetical protein